MDGRCPCGVGKGTSNSNWQPYMVSEVGEYTHKSRCYIEFLLVPHYVAYVMILPTQSLSIYEDFGDRRRYMRWIKVIASHCILNMGTKQHHIKCWYQPVNPGSYRWIFLFSYVTTSFNYGASTKSRGNCLRWRHTLLFNIPSQNRPLIIAQAQAFGWHTCQKLFSLWATIFYKEENLNAVAVNS